MSKKKTMENNILGGLTGLPPTLPTNYFGTPKDAIVTPNNNPLSVNKNTSAMKTYILNQDEYGYEPNRLGGLPTILAFKKGDKVQSDKIENVYIGRGGLPLTTPIKGITVNPTIPNTKAISPAFIPLTSLTEVTGSTNEPTSTNTDVVTIPKNQLLQYAVIGLIIYVVFIK